MQTDAGSQQMFLCKFSVWGEGLYLTEAIMISSAVAEEEQYAAMRSLEGTNPNAAGIDGAPRMPRGRHETLTGNSLSVQLVSSSNGSILIDSSNTRKPRENKCASRGTSKKNVGS